MARPPAQRLAEIEREVVGCTRCPRLVAWRTEVGRDAPPRYAGEAYWARPVPGFGDARAGVYVLGLATSAHGGNRTGRAFTGNATADWLIAAMHRAGLASQATSQHRDDGLVLRGTWMGSAVRCAPPQNKPTIDERDACTPYLRAELDALTQLRVVIALGAFAWAAACRVLDVRPRPRFGHGAEVPLPDERWLLGCYHPSRQNTATGVLTETMLDDVMGRARQLTDS